MVLSSVVMWGAIAVGSALLALLGSTRDVVPGACERLEGYLLDNIVGQDLALRQLTDAVCDHLAQPFPVRPLIVSAHGPPGVGKTLTHRLLARALYNKKPTSNLECPGRDCPPYKVMYGLYYVEGERKEQHNRVREVILEHLRRYPAALLVVEEYDKLDCPSRAVLRQLLENPREANLSSARFIVLLESNVGYPELHALSKAAKGKQVTAEAAERALKDLVHEKWEKQDCEDHIDTLKMIGLVNFFLPYFPLERSHLETLFRMHVKQRAPYLNTSPDVFTFLADKVDYEDGYPIEGAKEVETLVTRYVTRALREAEPSLLKEGSRLSVCPKKSCLHVEPAD